MIVFAAALCMGSSGGLSRAQAAQENRRLLEHWAGGSIRRLPEADRKRFQAFVDQHLVTLKGCRPFLGSVVEIFNGGDAYVWSFKLKPEAGYLVLLNPYTPIVPAEEHAWIFVLNHEGKVLNHRDFDIGSRMHAGSASFGPVNWLSSPALLQETVRGLNGGPPLRIWIAFDGTRPATVRVETEDGAPHKMPYFIPNWVVGPSYEPPKLVDLVRVLRSGSEVRTLEALTWLDGRHAHESDNRDHFAHEDISGERSYAAAIKSPQVTSAVKKLRLSNNQYTRQLAADVPLGRGDFGNWLKWLPKARKATFITEQNH